MHKQTTKQLRGQRPSDGCSQTRGIWGKLMLEGLVWLLGLLQQSPRGRRGSAAVWGALGPCRKRLAHWHFNRAGLCQLGIQLVEKLRISGCDGLGRARFLKTKLETIPRTVGCNRDSGDRGSNTVFGGNVWGWGGLKQIFWNSGDGGS